MGICLCSSEQENNPKLSPRGYQSGSSCWSMQDWEQGYEGTRVRETKADPLVFLQSDEWVTQLTNLSESLSTRGISRVTFERECADLKRGTEHVSMNAQGSADPERFSMLELTDILQNTEVRRRVTRKLTSITPAPVVKKNGVWFCDSFSQYHENREIIFEPYEVLLEPYNPEWKSKAREIINDLRTMECSKEWVGVEHIGSTAVTGLGGKPILDLMIIIKSEDHFESAVNDFLRDQENLALPFRIGFTDMAPCSTENWGFFQIPRDVASKENMCEVNVHIYANNSTNVNDKRLFRDFLNANADAREEYKKVKLELMQMIERSEIPVAVYAKHKNKVVSKLLSEAHIWKYENIGELSPVRKKRSSVQVVL